MSTTYLVVIAVAVVVVVGVLWGLASSRRRRSQQEHDKLGPEYERTVLAMGSEQKAQAELDERRKRVQALDIRTLPDSERAAFATAWTAIQSKFVDEPGQAIADAGHLITQVMQARAYPVADFEQRAADLSVNYPTLVSNYRAAREIAAKHERGQADTEELRTAMIFYRSLFGELLGTEPVTAPVAA